MGVVGDFSSIDPNGVRVKGFACGVSGLGVAPVNGWGCGLPRMLDQG